MPLGDKVGWEKSESRYCGVETEFNDDMPQFLSFNLSNGGFDFVVAPLVRLLPLLSFNLNFLRTCYLIIGPFCLTNTITTLRSPLYLFS